MLQRHFSRLGHALARELREDGLLDSACGYVQTRHAERFLREHSDLRYDPLIVDDDLYHAAAAERVDIAYLDSLEREFGLPHLWPYIGIDRTLTMDVPNHQYPSKPPFTHEQLLSHLQVRFRAILRMLDDNRPDYVLISCVGSMGAMILYHAARKRGIPTLVLGSIRTGNRVTLLDNALDDVSEFVPRFQELTRGAPSPFRNEAREFLRNFRGQHSRYEGYVPPPAKPPLPIWLAQSAKRLYKHFRAFYRDGGGDEPSIESPASYVRNRIERNLRLWARVYPKFSAPVPGERYAFLPLSQDPEISTLLWAPYATNPLALAQYLAKSLPATYKLYVKDHPWMLGPRPVSFYRELLNLPNVRLIDPMADSRPILEGCALIATVTGTAGWEGLMLGKPVLTFGSVFYNAFPQTVRVRDLEELPTIIDHMLKSYWLEEQALVDFLATLMENTISADYSKLWNVLTYDEILKHPDLKVLARHSAQRIRKFIQAASRTKELT